MVVWGETAPHLLNLARYNLAVQRPQVAQRFINVLKQSLFYSDARFAHWSSNQRRHPMNYPTTH